MARLKRSSQVLEKAERRCAGLKSISVTLDLGDGLTLENYLLMIDGLRSQLTSYNESLSIVDRAAGIVQDTEQQLKTLSERMLIAVAAKYARTATNMKWQVVPARAIVNVLPAGVRSAPKELLLRHIKEFSRWVSVSITHYHCCY
jgi:hypothetical protein